MEKISVVATVKNDPDGVKVLLSDLAKQTMKADEIIVVRAEDYRNCSRGRGRNIGIEKAKNEIIAVTDVGCKPHKDWLQKLTAPLFNKEGDVAGGFYKTVAKTSLQKAIAPYLAVMPNRWNENYLPASRSIGFTKSVWKKVGGYPEEAKAGGEDLEFARRLRDEPGVKIKPVPQALVDWEVPNNLADFMRDIYKHTMGNFEVGYWPHVWKNLSVVLRWVVFVLYPWLLVPYLVWVLGKLESASWRMGKLGILGVIQIGICLPVVQVAADTIVIVTIAVWGLEKLRLRGWVGSAD